MIFSLSKSSFKLGLFERAASNFLFSSSSFWYASAVGLWRSWALNSAISDSIPVGVAELWSKASPSRVSRTDWLSFSFLNSVAFFSAICFVWDLRLLAMGSESSNSSSACLITFIFLVSLSKVSENLINSPYRSFSIVREIRFRLEEFSGDAGRLCFLILFSSEEKSSLETKSEVDCCDLLAALISVKAFPLWFSHLIPYLTSFLLANVRMSRLTAQVTWNHCLQPGNLHRIVKPTFWEHI